MPIHSTRPLMLAMIMLMITVAARAQNPRSTSLSFVENRGQIVDADKHPRPDILFTAQSRGVAVYLRTAGLSYVFVRLDGDSLRRHPGRFDELRWHADTSLTMTTYRMDVKLIGANSGARVEAGDTSADYTNYYLAHCPQGITGVRAFRRVTYHDIYPHIDLVYYGNEVGMKYDFIVRPGGRVSDIRLRYMGSNGLVPTTDGRVLAPGPLGTVEEGRLEVYSTGDGIVPSRRSVEARYHVANSTITFDVGAYDHDQVLVIDPTLLWSTYIGGSDFELGPRFPGWNAWAGVNVGACHGGNDTSMSIGSTSNSNDFPTTAGVVKQTKADNYQDVVIARLGSHGGRMWATYFGGSGHEWLESLADNALNECLIVGISQSNNLPTTAASFNRTNVPGGSGFITKLDAQGRLAWCTYYNGAGPLGVVGDRRGNIVVCGYASGPIATPGAFQITPPPTGSKGFITRFSPTGARLWCTYFGGTPTNLSMNDAAVSVALDSNGAIYACGGSGWDDFPIVGNAVQPTRHGALDAWLAKLDSNGTPLWSTFLGGTASEFAVDVAVDSRGNPVIAGLTLSTDLPVSANAFQPANASAAGVDDAFLARYDATGHQRWATYYGGISNDDAGCIAVDGRDNIWLGLSTYSPGFPATPDAFQTTPGWQYDGAIAKFDSSGRGLWATYLGGDNWDFLNGLWPSAFGIVASGTTGSSDFPVAGTPFQNHRAGSYDLFATAFCDPDPVIYWGNHPLRFCDGDSVALSVQAGYDHYLWSTGATTRNIVAHTNGMYYVTVDIAGCSASDSVAVTVFPIPQRRVVPSGPIVLCEGDSAVLRLDGPAAVWRWSTGDTTATITVKTAGRYSAFFIDANGCSNRTDTVVVLISARPTTSITVTGQLKFCEGGSVVLDAGPGFAGYKWSTGDSTQRITVTKPGTYAVRVMNRDGCWGALSSSVTVVVFPKPTIGLRSMLPTTFCEGDSTIIVASPTTFASYLWSTGETTPTIVVKKDGTYTLVATDSNGCTATGRMTVTVKPGPQAKLSLSGPPRFCRGDSLILSTGTFAQYQWSNGAASQSIVVKDPGKYFVTVMTDGGCYGTSDTATVEVSPRPSVAISGPIRVCPNTLADYNAPASSRTTYLWTVPSGGAIVSGGASGSVSVQWGAVGTGQLRLFAMNDSTGCSADTSITVAIGSSLTPVVTADRSLKLCTGDSVTLDAGAYATYQWSTGATSRTITVDAPGTYSVTVADAKGCSGTSDPVTVTMNLPPLPVIAVPNGGVFCAGDSIVLDAGPGYAKYLWGNGYTSRRIVLRAPTRIAVTVTDTNGCMGTSAEVGVSVSPQTPPLVIGPQQVCRNSTVTYSTTATAGSSYQWSVTGGTLLSGQGSASIRVGWGGTGNGRVDLVETTSLGCMGASPGLDVTIGDHLVPVITPAGTAALCPGAVVHLDAGAGYATYQWSNGEKTQAIDVTTVGSFTVTVADSTGCSGTSAPVSVVAKAAPVPATSGGPLEFCEGGSVTLTAEPGYVSYLWSTGERSPVITVTSAGSYTVTVVDVDGCTGTSKPAVVVVDPLPAKPVITLAGDMLTSTPATKYQWLLDGTAITGATSQSLRATASGTYRVIVQNQYDCASVSDPVPFRIGPGPRLVMLDTISAHVGEHGYLTMRVMPALTAAEAVHAYHAELRYDPRALFIHNVVSPDRTATGERAAYHTDVTGLLTIDRAATSPALVGDELFQVELEGLVSGQPLNMMTIERIAMPEVAGVGVAGNGLVILSGCEIGTAFAKVVRIETVRPNPVREEMVVRYRLPAGRAGVLRLSDAAGREIVRATTPLGTGSFEELHVDLAHVASGVYMVELRDGAERSMVPVVIAK